MLAAHKVSPRAAQALMRHTDPRRTASVYTDEKLLPLAAELQNVPAIPADQHDAGQPATQPDLQAFVSELSTGQRQTMLRMLSRLRVG